MTAQKDEQNAQPIIDALTTARQRTLGLLSGLSESQLCRAYSPLLSPLVWDLGHIAAYEDLWLVHRHAGKRLLYPQLSGLYDAFETPRAMRGDLKCLSPAEALQYLTRVRRRTMRAIADRGFGDGSTHLMVAKHEQQHNETMLQTLTLGRLAHPQATAGTTTTAYTTSWSPDHEGGRRRPAVGLPRIASPLDERGVRRHPAGGAGLQTGIATLVPAPNQTDHTGLETVEVPAGRFLMGAAPGRFSHDNERPCHYVHVDGFRIGRTPVTNATWLSFAEGGGYERREWWSDEGWAWKEEYDISRPAGWSTDPRETGANQDFPQQSDVALALGGKPVFEWQAGRWRPLDPRKPVVHVSWFEADAFARAHGVRLPTEAEWEKAAAWDQHTGATLPWPWGGAAPRARHANLYESSLFATAPVASHPSGSAPCGALGMLGDVWEWTTSAFGGYSGFVAHPYREYSEVFFGSAYRVLRGGSWATSRFAISPTFRNWDLPQRRQIFAGLRIATRA